MTGEVWWSGSAHDEFSSLINEVFNAEMFGTQEAYALLRRVVGCQTEETDMELPTDPDFEAAIAKLHCEPAIRAVAPQAHLLILDCFGNCSDMAITEILRSVTKLVDLITSLTEDHHKQSQAAKQVLLPLPVSLLDEWWAESERGATCSQWLESLWFTLSVVLAIRRNHSEALFSLYWTWLRCALSERFVESQSARAAESLSNLTAPVIVSLVLTPFSQEDRDENTNAPQTKKRKAIAIQRSLLDLDFASVRNLFRDVWAVGGLLVGDLSIQALKKFVDTSAKEWDETRQSLIQHVFSILFTTCAGIDGALLDSNAKTINCVPRDEWHFSFRDVQSLKVSAVILCCNIVLRVLVPSAALQTKYLGISSQVRDTAARQQFTLAVVICLIQSVPSLLMGTPTTESVQVTETQVATMADDQSESDDSSEEEDVQSTRKKNTSKIKAAEDKRNRARLALENLTNSIGDPIIAFVSMVLFMAPEKREGRDRVIAFVCSVVEASLKFEFGLAFLSRLFALLMTLSNHHKSSIRLISMELSSALQDQMLPNIHQGKLPLALLHIFNALLLIRISDEQSTVRSRALDLMASLMSSLNRATPSPILDWYLSQLIARDTTPSLAFDWVTLVSLCDCRLEDDKSLVRKSLLPVIENCALCLERPELSTVSLADLFDSQLLQVLCDDVAITVRQKAVAVSANLLERLTVDMETRGQSLRNLLRLCLDSEETISSKALEHCRLLFFAKLPSCLKRFLSQLRDDENIHPDSSVAVSVPQREPSYVESMCNGDPDLSLMLILIASMELSESNETLARSLTKIHRTHPHTVDAIADAILENAESIHPLRLPSAVIQLLQLCIEITPKRSKINLRMPLDCFDAVVRDQLMIKPSNTSAVSAILDMLSLILPGRLDSKNCLHIKEHIMRCLMDFAVHPCLVKETLKLLFLLSGVDGQLLVDLVTASRKELAQIHGKEDEREIPSTSAISCCLLMLGSSYVISSLLPPSNKVSKFLQSIARPLAIASLSIASDAFRETAPSVSFTEPEEKNTNWLKQVPPWLRAVAVVSAGQILMASEAVAKKLCPRLLSAALSNETGRLNADLTSNVSFAVFDFSLRMTSLVDPYFTLVTSALAQPNAPHTSAFVRHQVLALVAQLVAQDFLKAKGLIMYHLLSALGDPSRSVRRLARSVVQRVISPRVRDLILLYFVEMICFTCGFLKHPEVPLALDAHPLQMAICNSNLIAVEAFQLPQSHRARLLIYSSLLSVASEQSKNLLTVKLIGDFLEPFVAHGQKSIQKRSQQLEVPKSSDTTAGLALMDVLTIISSSDLRLTFAPSNSEAGEDDTEVEQAKKIHYEKGVMKRFLGEHVLPRLMALRKAMQESNSTLQRDVLTCIARVTSDCSDDLSDLVSDPFLCQEIRARHSEENQNARVPLIPDSEITTADDDD